MAYVDPTFEQKRMQTLGIKSPINTSSGVTPKKTTFSNDKFEQQRTQILQKQQQEFQARPVQQAPLIAKPITQTAPIQKPKSLISQIDEFVGRKLDVLRPQGQKTGTIIPGGLKGAKERLVANKKELFLPTSSGLPGQVTRKYVKDTADSALRTIEGAGKLSPSYMVQRAIQKKPVTPKEYLDTVIALPVDTLSTLWHLSPAAPVWGAVMGELRVLRQKVQKKGTNLDWKDIEDILVGSMTGIADQPGVGETITDNEKTAQAIDIVFMATMVAKPFAAKKINSLNVKAVELNKVYKTLGVKPGASLKEVSEAFKKQVRKYPDTFTLNPNPEHMAIRKELTNAYAILKKAGVIDRKYARAYDFLQKFTGKPATQKVPTAQPKRLTSGEVTKTVVQEKKPVTVKPQEARDLIIGTNLQNTEFGKFLIKSSLDAEKMGNGITIAPVVETTPPKSIVTTPEGEKVSVEVAKEVEKPVEPNVTKGSLYDIGGNKVEIKKTDQLFQNGPDAGKPSGSIKYDVVVNGNEKGTIHYSPEMEKNYSKGGYQVASDSILGTYKSKYFKTLKGAQDFIVNSKEKYISLDQVDLMTGQRKVNVAQPPVSDIKAEVKTALQESQSPEEAVKNIDAVIKKIAKVTDRKVLKATRAELNRSMYGLVGVDTDNWKRNYAMFQQYRDAPEYKEIIDRMEEGIEQIDSKLQAQKVENKVPSGFASTGGYSTIESAEKSIGRVKAIEFPELLRIAETLGIRPKLSRQLRTAWGLAQGTTIKLSPKIFEDPKIAARVLAHEIGHVADFLPDKTMARGNLLGRIASLNKFLGSFLPEVPGEKGTITPKEREQLRKEAREIASRPYISTEEYKIGGATITAKDILAVWNDTSKSIQNSELVKYIAQLSDVEKVAIAREALKGSVPKWLKEGKLTREKMRNAPGDVKKIYRELLEREANKRRLLYIETVRDELKKMSQLWKPFDTTANPAFTKYRYSSAELYADAVSVLLNDPALLLKNAPTFYKGFFNYLDSKPAVEKQFEDIWKLLNEGEDEVFKKRDEFLSESFKKGEEAFAAKYLDKQKRTTSLMYQMKLLFDDVNTPIIEKMNQLRKKGQDIPPELNPDYALKGLLTSDGELKNYIQDNFQAALTKVVDVPEGWEKVGKVLFYERVMNERGELANPQGYDPKTAGDQLRLMEKNMSAEDWKKVNTAKELLRKSVQKSLDEAKDNGFYSSELVDKLKANPSYATFQVVDYLDTYITPRVYQQKGTLKDIANPATSTVMKLVSIHKSIKRNNVKKVNMEFLKKNFTGEIETAHTKWNGKSMDITDPKDPDKGLVITIEDGKPQGYYVDKNIAEMLNYTSNTTLEAAARISRAVSQSRFYRPMFTSYNLGFQSFNFVRDIRRAWRNFPQKRLIDVPLSPIVDAYRVGKGYARAVIPSAKRAMNIQDPVIKAMENANILGLTYNDVFSGEVNPEEKQIERIFQSVGLLEKSKKNRILRPFTYVLDKVSAMGDFVETVPKVAGYLELKDTMPEAELAEFIRTSVGSPNFRVHGTATPVLNNVFLFSNAIKEGIKSDFKVGTGKKGKSTGAGFWWKTIVGDFLPKAIMMAAAAGYFGKQMQDMMDRVSEYDKTNYTVIPLGMDEKGKAIYLRIPHDETGRFLGGLFWKSMNLNNDEGLLKNIADIFSFGAGNFPNLSPSFTGAGAVITYLSGNNPYDSYRNRNIIPDTEFKAGYKESFPIFMDWLIKNQGLGMFYPSYQPDDPTQLDKLLTAPVIANILGRWVRSSDYGQVEKLQKMSEQVEQEKAKETLRQRKLIDEAIKTYQSGDKSDKARIEIEKQLLKDVFSGQGEIEKQRITNVLNKFKVSLVRKESNSQIDKVIDAGTNDEKVQLLLQIQKTQTPEEFADTMNTLMKFKAVSADVGQEVKQKILENQQGRVPVTKILTDIFEQANHALVSEVYAAEDDKTLSVGDTYYFKPIKKDEKPKDNRNIIEKFGDALQDLFKSFQQDQEIVRANPELGVAFGENEPYRLEKLPNGITKILYPTGGSSHVPNADVPKYLATWEEMYEDATGKKYPEDAPHFLPQEKVKIEPTKQETPTATPTKVPEPTNSPVTTTTTRSPHQNAKDAVKNRPESVSAIEKAGKEYGVMADLLVDIGLSESSLDPENTAKKGGLNSTAGGMFMFIDSTWRETMRALKLPEETSKFDPEINARAAAYLISKGQLSRWDASKHNWGKYYSDEELKKYDKRLQ